MERPHPGQEGAHQPGERGVEAQGDEEQRQEEGGGEGKQKLEGHELAAGEEAVVAGGGELPGGGGGGLREALAPEEGVEVLREGEQEAEGEREDPELSAAIGEGDVGDARGVEEDVPGQRRGARGPEEEGGPEEEHRGPTRRW